MEKHTFTTSDFYKCVIDIVEQVNRSISNYNFKLIYKIDSTQPDLIHFTIFNEHSSVYTFTCTKEEYKGGQFIVNIILIHIQEVIRLELMKYIDPNVEYVDPEDLLHCQLTDCEYKEI